MFLTLRFWCFNWFKIKAMAYLSKW